MDFLQLLSPDLQAALLDGMMRGGGATFAGQLLQTAGQRVARRFRTRERQAALERALKNAFSAALSHWAISEQDEAHYVGIFQDWLLREEVLGEFSLLLTPNEEEELDIELLCEEFEATGYSPEHLISVPFSELVLDMVGAFYMAAAQEEVLQEALKIGLLRQMVERMGALERMEVLAARQAEASEQAVDQLTLIQRKSEALVSGQGLTNEWLQKIEGLLRETREDGMTQQLRTYQAVETLLARAYDVALEEGKRLDATADGQVAAQLAPVLGLLGEIRDQLSSEKAPDAAQLASIEQTYRQTLIELFETLTFKGISPSGRAIALPLADVYIELKAVADVPEAADTYSAEERRLLASAKASTPPSEERGLDGDALGIQLDSLRYQRWKERARQPAKALPRRSIQEILTDPAQRGVVILGDPGSGKTTLLHYLALQSARLDLPLEIAGSERRQQLPIFVPLAAYDDYLTRSQSHLSLGDFLPIYYERWRSLPALAPLFEQALAEGRAFLLLDGLDEVLSMRTRQFVANQVEGLIQQWAAKGNRFALLRSVVGYREAPLAGNLPHVTVLDFGRNEIERFTEQWCYAYEKWVADGKETAVVKQRAESEKEALLSDVRSNASIERLAASPLLLTMLALLRRQVGKLLDRRIELYQRYVRTLIDNWQSARSQGARQKEPKRFKTSTAIAHLIELALWLQQHKPSGTASRHELESILQEICLRFEGHDPTNPSRKASVQAQQEAERFRKDMRHLLTGGTGTQCLRLPAPYLPRILRWTCPRPHDTRRALANYPPPPAHPTLARTDHALRRTIRHPRTTPQASGRLRRLHPQCQQPTRTHPPPRSLPRHRHRHR
jgi:hypothetical protein